MSEKIRRRRFDGGDPMKKACRRRFFREDDCRKRGLTVESTMALIPCELREENNAFLY